MTQEIDALGDIASGTLIARAVEPVAGEGATARASQCSNCGGSLLGRHCHQCGQPASVHRSLSAFWHDFLHSILHLDGKIWRTLPLLFFKPGELTRRYVHGERARFVSPLALFLFSVFLMFAVFGALGGPFTPDVEVANNQAVGKPASALQKIVEAQSALKALERRQKSAPTEQRKSEIEALQSKITGMQTGATLSSVLRQDDSSSVFELSKADLDVGSPVWNDRIYRTFKNPKLLLYKVQSNAYKYSWILIILSTPLVWLLFAFRREYRLYDHAVFVTYSISFMSFMLVIMAAVRAVGIAPGYLILTAPVHMFLQLKGAYQLRKRSATWRTLALLTIAAAVLLVFAVLIIALGIEH
jgi:Protein of unknown function (DUF3667)